MTIQAHGKYVFIERDPIQQIGSILLAKELVADRGTVVSVGSKVLSDIKVGDVVLFKHWQERNTSHGKITVIKEIDVWAVIEE